MGILMMLLGKGAINEMEGENIQETISHFYLRPISKILG